MRSLRDHVSSIGLFPIEHSPIMTAVPRIHRRHDADHHHPTPHPGFFPSRKDRPRAAAWRDDNPQHPASLQPDASTDFLIIGAGFSGLVIAERLAAAGWKCVVVDRRDHLGGNAHDRIDAGGRADPPLRPALFPHQLAADRRLPVALHRVA